MLNCGEKSGVSGRKAAAHGTIDLFNSRIIRINYLEGGIKDALILNQCQIVASVQQHL